MVQFNYNTFYNYYTDPSNLNVDPNPPEYRYFNNNKSIKQRKAGYFIVIDGIKIYIDILSNRRLVFTIENPEHLDNHYHFGIDYIYRGKTRIEVIFFHKTMQEVDSSGNIINKLRKNCYFKSNADISDIAGLVCSQEKDRIMSDRFSETSQDFRFITEIISRPFPLPTKGGKHKRTKKYKTRSNKMKKRKTRRTRK